MASTIRSLWPTQIHADIKSPWAILRVQADALAVQTDSLLLGDVGRRESDDGRVLLTFDIAAPAINYQHRIMVVIHHRDMFYPAVVDAEVFRAKGLSGLQGFLAELGRVEESKKPPNRADDDQELIAIVAKVLSSPQVVSVAQSLIIRATESLDELSKRESPDQWSHPTTGGLTVDDDGATPPDSGGNAPEDPL